MGNFLLKHPSPAEINGNKVKSVFSYRLQHQKPLQGLLVNLSLGIHGPKPIGPGSGPKKLRNQGPTRTKTEYILKS